MKHSDGLFLVYTRRGANNDHVIRNRAPLFIAQVDPERLCVIRATEKAIVPDRGASLGNFGVANISDKNGTTPPICSTQRKHRRRDGPPPFDFLIVSDMLEQIKMIRRPAGSRIRSSVGLCTAPGTP